MPDNQPPNIIYLQWHDYDGEVTWCQDEINETDVKYVKISEVENAYKELMSFLESHADKKLLAHTTEFMRIRRLFCGGVE